MNVLYMDDAVAVCIKPVGIDSEHALPALMAEQYPQTDWYPVHRLDATVGGVIVMARTAQAAATLTRAIQEKTLRKEYRAVVYGIPPEGEWNDLLFWDARRRKSYPVKRERKGVKAARLHNRIIATAEKEGKTLSLLGLLLDTGRTHQIRVQCATRGYPLIGDGKYGGRDNRCPPALWAYCLAFLHPVTKETMTFTAPLPDTFPFSLFANIKESKCLLTL